MVPPIATVRVTVASIPAAAARRADAFCERPLGRVGVDAGRDTQIDGELARAAGERGCGRITPSDRGHDALGPVELIGSSLGPFGDPGLHVEDQVGRVGDGVAVGEQVAAAGIGVDARHPHREPGQADLAPRHRPAGLGDHSRIRANRVDKRPAPGAVAVPQVRRAAVHGHAQASEAGDDPSRQVGSGGRERLGRHEHARGVALGVVGAEPDHPAVLLAGFGLHVGSGLRAGPRLAEIRIPRGERVDRRVQQQGRAAPARSQNPPGVARTGIEPLGAALETGRVERLCNLHGQGPFLTRRRRRVDEHPGELAQPGRRHPGEGAVERAHGCDGGRTDPIQVPVVLVRRRTNSRFRKDTGFMTRR